MTTPTPTPFDQWTQEHKHTLRDLYAQFLDDTGATPEQLEAGEAISYSRFLAQLWRETKYATP